MTHHKTSDHVNLPSDAYLPTSGVTQLPSTQRNIGLRSWRVLGLMLLFGTTSQADDFEKISYDAATDELVIVINYSGTNPDHQFSLNWGECQTAADNQQELAGDLIDEQARDAAHQDYHKTLRFSLASVECRPAKVTLRTAPHFLATVSIPAARPKR